MTDEAKALVEQLRKEDEWTNQRPYFHAHAKSLEAADLIETQAAELAKLREALLKICHHSTDTYAHDTAAAALGES